MPSGFSAGLSTLRVDGFHKPLPPRLPGARQLFLSSPVTCSAPILQRTDKKNRQCPAFVEDVAHRPGTLDEVIEELAAFLMPHAIAAANPDR